MQRFKNLTKKSGKVASAILSAAMVTSMVLGTNVVEVKAADTTTEATVDVKATDKPDLTPEQQKIVAAAKEGADYFTNKVKNLPVTSTGAASYLQNATTFTASGAKEFDTAKTNALKKAGSGFTFSDLKMEVTTTPTATKDGELKFTGAVTNAAAGLGSTFTVTYKLDNFTKRAQEAAKLVQDAVDAAVPGGGADKGVVSANAIATKLTGDTNTGLSKTLSGDSDSIKLFDDITFSASDVYVAKSTPTEEDKDGVVSGIVTITAGDGNNTGVVKQDFERVFPSVNKQLANAENIADKVILSNDQTAVAPATEVTSAVDSGDVASLSQQVYNFLSNQGVYVSKVSTDAISADSITAATVSTDGSAKVKVRVVLDENKAGAAKEKTFEKEYKVYNNTSLVNDRFAEIEKAADQLKEEDVIDETVATSGTVNRTNIETAYKKLLAKQFNADQKDYLGNATVDADFGNFNNLYNGVTVTVSADKNSVDSNNEYGDYTVAIKVNSGDITKTLTKTVKGQTDAGKMETAVNTALDNLTFTNSTTSDDVKEAVEAAVASLDETAKVEVTLKNKTDATSTTEGTATVTVTVTSDGKETVVSKTYTIAKTAAKGQFVEKDGKKFYYGKDGQLLKNTFLQGTESPDGYTYYIQNDGSVMQDRLTYHPNGKDVIYFDAEGHEVFDAFVNVKKDVQGNAVDYIGYFGTLGGAYVNQTTYGNGVGAYSKDALFYINDYGVLENKGWFQNAAGNIGYAAANGTLTTNQWSLDQFGRKVYFQADGFLAKGLITDGVKYYQLDETDGHLVGEF